MKYTEYESCCLIVPSGFDAVLGFSYKSFCFFGHLVSPGQMQSACKNGASSGAIRCTICSIGWLFIGLNREDIRASWMTCFWIFLVTQFHRNCVRFTFALHCLSRHPFVTLLHHHHQSNPTFTQLRKSNFGHQDTENPAVQWTALRLAS